MPAIAHERDQRATPYADFEIFCEEYHAHLGMFQSVPSREAMEQMLLNEMAFAARCEASPPVFFFGPIKELLREVAYALCEPHRNARIAHNLDRMRRCARRVALALWWHRSAMARTYAVGGPGFAAAQADFEFHAAQ